jgi:hypothetical protein
VLVLGTYHMDNPGPDLHNTKADDVLAPKRQAEIEELTAVLARFRFTKIAVEWDAGVPVFDRFMLASVSHQQYTSEKLKQGLRG